MVGCMYHVHWNVLNAFAATGSTRAITHNQMSANDTVSQPGNHQVVWCLLSPSVMASLQKKVVHSFAIPSVMDKTSGVNAICSTSLIHIDCSLSFWQTH